MPGWSSQAIAMKPARPLWGLSFRAQLLRPRSNLAVMRIERRHERPIFTASAPVAIFCDLVCGIGGLWPLCVRYLIVGYHVGVLAAQDILIIAFFTPPVSCRGRRPCARPAQSECKPGTRIIIKFGCKTNLQAASLLAEKSILAVVPPHLGRFFPPPAYVLCFLSQIIDGLRT